MIPQWNNAGVLPPILHGEEGASPKRSPYDCSLLNVIERFATSEKRIEILQGFLSYRQALYKAGVTEGFQWLNGSFVENKEALEGSPPNDIDVVTFFPYPDSHASFVHLFDIASIKQEFLVDAYPCDLKLQRAEKNINKEQIKMATYWYSMWSHRRNSSWKGYLQVDLPSTSSTDKTANNRLQELKEERGITS